MTKPVLLPVSCFNCLTVNRGLINIPVVSLEQLLYQSNSLSRPRFEILLTVLAIGT